MNHPQYRIPETTASIRQLVPTGILLLISILFIHYPIAILVLLALVVLIVGARCVQRTGYLSLATCLPNQHLQLAAVTGVFSRSHKHQRDEQLRIQVAALNAAANAIMIVDAAGTIIWVNSAFTALTGFTAADVIDKHPREVLRSGVHDADFYAHQWHTMQAGQVWEGHITNKRKDGSLYLEQQTITPVLNEHGQITHYIAVKDDITEVAERQSEIERQNKELQRFNELKNTFLSIAAHDLRNPISQVLMTVEFMRDPVSALSPEESQALLDNVVRQSEHMLNLINNLLDVSRIESGRLELLCEAIEMQQFVNQIVVNQAQLASHKGTQVELEANSSGTCMADPTRMRQVIENLISNAVKFSPPNSTVQVTCEREQASWLIRVRDEGPGINAKDRERLFGDFERLSARPTAGESSTGLGLAISKRIMEAHNGDIGVDSEFGQGATFWVRIPC